MAKKWLCSTDETHIFDSPTADLFCSQCPPYSGVLMEVASSIEHNTQSNPPPAPVQQPVEQGKKGVGLYMFLIDSSGSMFAEDAFHNVPMKRAKLVSGQVANAIFEMENLNKKDSAYLYIVLFDHRQTPFINFLNVREVFEKYGNAVTLENELYKAMQGMNGATDINAVLKNAYVQAQKFIEGKIDGIGAVEPMTNSVINPQTGDDKTYPNVRCLIFTDGEQYTQANVNERIEGNPFDNFIFNSQNANILMGAYHGDENSEGYRQLKSIMGNCHIHGVPQFFHFGEAAHTIRMRHLFRMGSGPSGFCERCLDNFMTDVIKPKNR